MKQVSHRKIPPLDFKDGELQDIRNLIKIERLTKNINKKPKEIAIETTEEQYKLNEGNNKNNNQMKQIETLTYLPKRNIKFIPDTLLSYPNPGSFMKKINQIAEREKFSFQSSVQNGSPKERFMQMSTDTLDIFNFQTKYMLNFAHNIEAYEKFNKYFDLISLSNQKVIFECFSKLKYITDKKEKIFFENPTNFSSGSNINLTNINNWKECVTLFYEFECHWQKFTETILKELKMTREQNIQLLKKANDQGYVINAKEKQLDVLNQFIDQNDITYKGNLKTKKQKQQEDLQKEYERKGNLNLINVFRLEEEIKDLTSLLDRDKDFYQKYQESLNILSTKKKEIDEMRAKFNMELEEKRLIIVYLNNEKNELTQRVVDLEKEVNEFKETFEKMNKEYIEYHTQFRVFKQTIQEKNENIDMLSEEIDTWICSLYKERLNLYNCEQTITHLEIKLQLLNREKTTKQSSIKLGINNPVILSDINS